jgi:hypothetical protein
MTGYTPRIDTVSLWCLRKKTQPCAPWQMSDVDAFLYSAVIIKMMDKNPVYQFKQNIS